MPETGQTIAHFKILEKIGSGGKSGRTQIPAKLSLKHLSSMKRCPRPMPSPDR